MTEDTSMLRISKEYKQMLKEYAAKEGRTLEWCANQAIEDFITEDGTDKYRKNARAVKEHIVAEGKRLGVLPEPELVPDSQESEEPTNFCRHGQVVGFCKKGCK